MFLPGLKTGTEDRKIKKVGGLASALHEQSLRETKGIKRGKRTSNT